MLKQVSWQLSEMLLLAGLRRLENIFLFRQVICRGRNAKLRLGVMEKKIRIMPCAPDLPFGLVKNNYSLQVDMGKLKRMVRMGGSEKQAGKSRSICWLALKILILTGQHT